MFTNLISFLVEVRKCLSFRINKTWSGLHFDGKNLNAILSVCGIHIHSETLTARKNTAVGTQVCEIRNVTGYAKFGHHRKCRVWQFSQHVSFGDPNNRVTMTRVSEPQRNEVNRFQKQWNSWPRLILPNCFNLVLLPQTWSKLAGFKTTVFTKVSLIEISPM